MDSMTNLELGTYLARIGIDATPTIDPEGLLTLQQAQRRSIPFENIDVLLGRGINIESDAIFTKLVASARGGYCFELNALFLRALRTIGFEARPLLGRVWLGATDVPPRTHTFNLVRLRDVNWTADAGFGGGDAPPMPLRVGKHSGSDGVSHELKRDDAHGWMLTRDDIPQYSFTEAEVWPNDLAQANHWTATAPTSRFVRNLFVSVMTANGLRKFNRSRHLPNDRETAVMDAHALAEQLRREFGIQLSEDEIADLPKFGIV